MHWLLLNTLKNNKLTNPKDKRRKQMCIRDSTHIKYYIGTDTLMTFYYYTGETKDNVNSY